MISQSVYRKLLPLYFPRSEEEERACLPLLPADIGNSEGEPIVPERQIRIAEKPGILEGADLCLGFSAFHRQDGFHCCACRLEEDFDSNASNRFLFLTEN